MESSNPKMVELFKKLDMWWKEGDKIVMDENHASDEIGIVDFVHSDDMLSIKFGERHELYFHEQVRKPVKFEIERNARMWRDPPSFHCTNGHDEFDD